MPVNLYLIRGLPGSGKSTMAEQMELSGMVSLHFEADQYFIDNGEYKFDPSKLHDAHSWCLQRTERALSEGKNVVVSNTFTTVKELKPYFKLAAKYGANVTVLTANGNFGSIHDAPEETISKMRNRFQHDIDELYLDYNKRFFSSVE